MVRNERIVDPITLLNQDVLQLRCWMVCVQKLIRGNSGCVIITSLPICRQNYVLGASGNEPNRIRGDQIGRIKRYCWMNKHVLGEMILLSHSRDAASCAVESE